MKIIIVGCGKVGQELAERLNREGHDVTVIDIRGQVVQNLTNRFDIMGVEGNAMDVETLKEAGIQNADILIAVTGSDELNMFQCLMAKKLGNCRTIARVRNHDCNKALQYFKEELGLAMVINPEQTAANEIARAIRLPSAIQIDTFAKGRVEILKFRISEGSILDNLMVQDIVAKLNCDILVCGVERGSDAFIPRGNFVLKEGDLVSIVASVKSGALFFKRIGIKTDSAKDTMIVGGGEIAYYLANQLSEYGIDVKIIEQNPERCEELCRLLPKVNVINGDGTDRELLTEEGIDKADSFVSLTNIDEENMILSLFAKTKNDGKVVTKINRIEYDEVVESLDIGTVIYPKEITAEYIVKFVRAKKNSMGSNIETMHIILNGMAEALEFRIKEKSPVADVSIDSLKLKDNLLIACINRNGKIIIPRGKDIIRRGDTVIVVTLKSGFKDIDDILR
ncbi:MAG: Trk system potassium transporter TrkA [Clostridia bacterium]|nr:Trk system potassium transporter TrkA [Clostridia bacterium]